MDDIKYWLRWIAVFPGAIMAGLLATFPLHWILYLAFAQDGTIFGIIELSPGANIFTEQLLSPFIIAVTFIFVGYKIAPKYKFKAAVVLFGVYSIAWLALIAVALSGSSFYGITMHFSGRMVLALLGAIIGLYEVKREDRGVNA